MLESVKAPIADAINGICDLKTRPTLLAIAGMLLIAVVGIIATAGVGKDNRYDPHMRGIISQESQRKYSIDEKGRMCEQEIQQANSPQEARERCQAVFRLPSVESYNPKVKFVENFDEVWNKAKGRS